MKKTVITETLRAYADFLREEYLEDHIDSRTGALIPFPYDRKKHTDEEYTTQLARIRVSIAVYQKCKECMNRPEGVYTLDDWFEVSIRSYNVDGDATKGMRNFKDPVSAKAQKSLLHHLREILSNTAEMYEKI